MGTVNTFLLCFSAVIFSLQGMEAVDCPKAWKAYHDFCYGVMQMSETWADAEVNCQSKGLNGHLASIPAPSEMTLIAGMMTHNYPDIKELWVGLEDPRQTDHWQWSDSNPFNFNEWSRSSIGERGYCAYISSRTGFKQLEKSSCHMSKSYLCKSIF